uniref:Uncharacterized protein n=1 Tax=Timema poppense TaxID=170557 RepID=A0A7R9GWH4_TIMPO|nr:unnamed protein product [Timema poppensis]
MSSGFMKGFGKEKVGLAMPKVWRNTRVGGVEEISGLLIWKGTVPATPSSMANPLFRHVRDSSYHSFIYGKSLILSRQGQFLPLLHPWRIPHFLTSGTVPTTPSSMANPLFRHVRDSSYHSFIHGKSLNSSRQEQFLQLLNLCRIPHLSAKGNDSSTFIQIKRLVSRWSAKRRMAQRDRVKGEGVVNKIKRIQEREGKDDNVPLSPNLFFNVRLFYFHVSEHCLHSMIWNGGAKGGS